MRLYEIPTAERFTVMFVDIIFLNYAEGCGEETACR